MLTVEAFFGPRGALKAAFEDYELRNEQLLMARAVERALAERHHLFAEAGTGTGKTLAYLVPAVLSARKVVISTATKTLQEQVFLKDIPLLADKVGLSFTAACLKGRSNYLCLERMAAFERAPLFSTQGEAALWPRLLDWAGVTQTGDRAELDLPETFLAWKQLSTTRETCLGSSCPRFDACFVTRARRRGEAADLLVVNHHLFFADLALRGRAGAGGEGILPGYDAVIFDEAHAVEDIATEFFGTQLSNFRVEELVGDSLRALTPEDGRFRTLADLARALRAASDSFFGGLVQSLERRGGEGPVRLLPARAEGLQPERSLLAERLLALGAYLASAEEVPLRALSRRSREMAGEVEFVGKAEEDGFVFSVESRGRGLFVKASPIDVAERLAERLYRTTDTVVFTSATLTSGKSFDFFSRRVGLPLEPGEARGSVDRLVVASPFSFETQTVLYLPDALPDPNEPGFLEAAAEEMCELARLTQGRAFLLFTSLKNMEAARRWMEGRLPFPLLIQGERPKGALLSAFRSRPSVLFASHSFWEGVDVPGEALSLVVMDRLPFASPGDPLVSARIDALRDQGRDAFLEYQVPRAAILLRQGFGRLIRTRSDRGVVAILDRRITSKPYGQVFLQSLPEVPRYCERPEVEAWFAKRSR